MYNGAVFKSHIAVDSKIVIHPEFETAIVHANDGELSLDEKAILTNLGLLTQNAAASTETDGETFAESLLAAKRKKMSENAIQPKLLWIKPTSNIVGRLFSRTKVKFGTLQHRLDPVTIEENLFLSVNKRFRTVVAIAYIVNHIPEND